MKKVVCSVAQIYVIEQRAQKNTNLSRNLQFLALITFLALFVNEERE